MSSFPVIATPFIGRDAELTEITVLLHDPTCRLLTLVGPGGIGKTRLAIEVARLCSFPNSVHFIPFQPVTSADFMVSTIAEAVDFQFYTGADPKQQLLDYLSERSLLLILDNLEHLLDGVTLLSEILAAAPQIRILAASRERLNLREEWVFEVMGLSYPLSEAETKLALYSAIALFQQQARHANVSFSMTEEQLPFVIRICRLVGGMPLGIELAATWVRVLSCEQIANEIEHSLDILETKTRNVEPRHRTMRAAFDQSWNLLSDSERDVFKKLSMFRGGFTRESAEYVADASLRTLTALVDKSLLRMNAQGRYDVHELLRQYAEEKLQLVPAEQEYALNRHCTYYANFMGQWANDPIKIEQDEVIERVLEDIDNVRTAFRWAIDGLKLNEMDKFVHTLVHFYDCQDWYQEGVETLRLAAHSLRERLDETQDHLTLTRIAGLSLSWQAWFLNDLLQIDEARQLAKESLDLLLPLGDGREIIYSYICLAQLTNDAMELRQFAEESLKRAQAIGFFWGIVVSSQHLSWVLSELGEFENALQLLQESLSLCRKLDARRAESWTLLHLSEVSRCRGNLIEAQHLAQEALTIAESIGSRHTMLVHHQSLGDIAYHMGNSAEARLHFQASLALAQEIGNRKHVVVTQLSLGRLAGRLGNTHEARNHFSKALSIMQNTQDADFLQFTLAGVAQLVATQGNIEQAVTFIVHPFQQSKGDWRLRQWVEPLRSELEVALMPDSYTAAWERGMTLELNMLMTELLVELSQPTQPAESVIPQMPVTSRTELLTEREQQILCLIADGLSNREIAEELIFSLGTVKWYVHQLYGKLNVGSRTQAIARGKELNLLT